MPRDYGELAGEPEGSRIHMIFLYPRDGNDWCLRFSDFSSFTFSGRSLIPMYFPIGTFRRRERFIFGTEIRGLHGGGLLLPEAGWYHRLVLPNGSTTFDFVEITPEHCYRKLVIPAMCNGGSGLSFALVLFIKVPLWPFHTVT